MALIDKLRGYKTLAEPVKASVWYTVCNVLNKGLALLATPIFTRIMTEEQYGSFAIFQSWYSIILIFTSLNIFLNSYSKGLLTYEKDRDGFTSSMLGLTSLITGCFGLLYILFSGFWTEVLELSPALMGAMFVELLTMPALEFWAARQRFDYKYRKYVAISLLQSVLSLGLGVTAVLCTDSKLEARVYSDVFSKALFAGTLFVLIFWRGKRFYHREYWRFALAFNLPLIPHYLSNYVLNQSDRIMISRMVGDTQAAYYSVAYTISTVMNLVMMAILNSLTPYVYKSIKAGEADKIKMVTRPLYLLVAALCILTMCFAPEVILIFAGRAYVDAIWVIPPIAASVYFIFVYSGFCNVEYYYQKTGSVAVASCLAAVANLALNYVCIKWFGYYAAGYTTLACYLLLAVFHYVAYRRVLRDNMGRKEPLYDNGVILGCSLLVLAVMIVMVLTYRHAPVRYGLLTVLVILAVLNRKKLLGAIRQIK